MLKLTASLEEGRVIFDVEAPFDFDPRHDIIGDPDLYVQACNEAGLDWADALVRPAVRGTAGVTLGMPFGYWEYLRTVLWRSTVDVYGGDS